MAIVGWAETALREMLSLTGEHLSTGAIDLAAAAVGDRVHDELWPGSWADEVWD